MLEHLWDILFPPKCVFCRRVLTEGEVEICTVCRGRILLPDIKPRTAKGAFYDAAISSLWYEDEVREALHRFKFSGRQNYARPLARIMAHTAAEKLTQRPDVITWVPTNRMNMRRRGYNHAELLARELAGFMEMPCVDMLKKNRRTAPMFNLKPDQRRANVLGAFELSCRADEIEGKHVLLTDDILTTGSTASECARVLKMNGAKRVTVIAAASPRK